MDISDLPITKAQASRMLDEVVAGREPTVRHALILWGGIAKGELPDVDEVRVSRKLGRVVVYLPRDMELPPHDGKVIAEQVSGGILIKFAGASGEPDRKEGTAC